MKIYINDIPVSLEASEKSIKLQNFDVRVNGSQPINWSSTRFNGKVLISKPTYDNLDALYRNLHSSKFPRVKSVVLFSSQAKTWFKKNFKRVDAAGGLVWKEDQVLMIHRLGRWDLPKGKLDKDENFRRAAVREVEEECGVKVNIIGKKLCNTWHTYSLKGNKVLKKTAWYEMNCEDDRGLAPQIEENIDRVGWFCKKQCKENLSDSYKTIERVFKKSKRFQSL